MKAYHIKKHDSREFGRIKPVTWCLNGKGCNRRIKDKWWLCVCVCAGSCLCVCVWVSVCANIAIHLYSNLKRSSKIYHYSSLIKRTRTDKTIRERWSDTTHTKNNYSSCSFWANVVRAEASEGILANSIASSSLASERYET